MQASSHSHSHSPSHSQSKSLIHFYLDQDQDRNIETDHYQQVQPRTVHTGTATQTQAPSAASTNHSNGNNNDNSHGTSTATTTNGTTDTTDSFGGFHSVNIPNDTTPFAPSSSSATTGQQVHLRFHHVSKKLDVPPGMGVQPNAEGKCIKFLLDDVSGEVRPRQILALMGPSGSGKTTLLNTLSGRAQNGVTGSVLLNGKPFDKSMKRKIAYVKQEDLFFMSLTVRQQLVYTAKLRLPGEWKDEQKIEQVDRVIEELGLGKCQHTPIMLVSGGEKKRVNIASELLTSPFLLFLDEPTSGLDSTSAVALMATLRNLAENGKTIVLSIHQPSSAVFQSFDSLILLADGKMIYQGSPKEAVGYFAELGHPSPAQYNPADHVMDVLKMDKEALDPLKEAYPSRHSELTKGWELEASEPASREGEGELLYANGTKWPTTFFQQFAVLYHRCHVLSKGSLFTRLNVTQCIILALIAGLAWFRMDQVEAAVPDRSAFIFFVMTFWPFQTLFLGLMSFPFERQVIDKERESGSYRLSSYFLAKSAAEAPLKLVLPTVFLIISYWMANINPGFQYFLGVLAAELLCVLVAESIGLFIGAAIPNLMEAMTAATISMLGTMLFGGFFVKNLPFFLIWVKWLSIFTYAFDICLQLVFAGDYAYRCDGSNNIPQCNGQPGDSTMTFSGSQALDHIGRDLQIGWDFLILFAILIGFRYFAYLALRYTKIGGGRM